MDIRHDLLSRVEFYTQNSNLLEIFHDGTIDRGTHHNEAVNNSKLTTAPKARNYATLFSFNDGTNTMVGIHHFRHLLFYTAVNCLLGTEIPRYLREYLENKDTKKAEKRLYKRRPQVKRKRKSSYANKYIDKSSIQQEGFYTSNSGLCIETTIADEEEKDKANKDYLQMMCKSGCDLQGHYNKSSYLCPLNQQTIENAKAFKVSMVGESTRKPAICTRESKERNTMVEIHALNSREMTQNRTETKEKKSYEILNPIVKNALETDKILI